MTKLYTGLISLQFFITLKGLAGIFVSLERLLILILFSGNKSDDARVPVVLGVPDHGVHRPTAGDGGANFDQPFLLGGRPTAARQIRRT